MVQGAVATWRRRDVNDGARSLPLPVPYRRSQSLFNPLPHVLDRNPHARSVAATAAIAIDAAIEVEALDDDVVRRERTVAARRGRAEDGHDRRPRRRRDVHRPSVSADEEFRAPRQREELFERGGEHNRRVRARMIYHRLRQILFAGAVSHYRTHRVGFPQAVRDCAEPLGAPELGGPPAAGVEDREAPVESLDLLSGESFVFARQGNRELVLPRHVAAEMLDEL